MTQATKLVPSKRLATAIYVMKMKQVFVDLAKQQGFPFTDPDLGDEDFLVSFTTAFSFRVNYPEMDEMVDPAETFEPEERTPELQAELERVLEKLEERGL